MALRSIFYLSKKLNNPRRVRTCDSVQRLNSETTSPDSLVHYCMLIYQAKCCELCPILGSISLFVEYS